MTYKLPNDGSAYAFVTREEMKIRYRLLHKHRKKCNAAWCLLGHLPIAESVLSAKQFRGIYTCDSLGRRENGHRRWLVAGCNSIRCKASIAISEEDILRQIPICKEKK